MFFQEGSRRVQEWYICEKRSADNNKGEPSGSTKDDEATDVEAREAIKECNICMSKFVNFDKFQILT